MDAIVCFDCSPPYILTFYNSCIFCFNYIISFYSFAIYFVLLLF